MRPVSVQTGGGLSPRQTDKTARVWDAESGKPVGEPMRHEGTKSMRPVSVQTGGGLSPPQRTKPRACGTPRAASR